MFSSFDESLYTASCEAGLSNPGNSAETSQVAAASQQQLCPEYRISLLYCCVLTLLVAIATFHFWTRFMPVTRSTRGRGADTSSTAEGRSLDLGGSSNCQHTDIAATEREEVQTVSQATAHDNPPKLGLPGQGSVPSPDPQGVPAEASRHRSGSVKVMPAWQKWYQMQDSFDLTAAKAASTVRGPAKQQPRIQSITSAVFPPASLTETAQTRPGRRRSWHSVADQTGSSPAARGRLRNQHFQLPRLSGHVTSKLATHTGSATRLVLTDTSMPYKAFVPERKSYVEQRRSQRP